MAGNAGDDRLSEDGALLNVGYPANVMIGRGWFGVFYAAFFMAWGVYKIIERPHGSLVLGILLLLVGISSGVMWLRNWLLARQGAQLRPEGDSNSMKPSDRSGLFSPGRWWGFNGVLRLSVADDSLVIVPVGGWKSRPRSERRIALSKIELLSLRTRSGLFGRPAVLVVELRIDGKRSTFTSKYQDQVQFLNALPAEPSHRRND